MRKFLNLFALSLVLFVAYGCSDDDDPIAYERIVLNATDASGKGLNQITDWPNNTPSWPVWRGITSRVLVPSNGGTFTFTGVVDSNKGGNPTCEKIGIAAISLYGTNLSWTPNGTTALSDLGIESISRTGDNAVQISFMPNTTDNVRQLMIDYQAIGKSGVNNEDLSTTGSCACIVFNSGTLVDNFYNGTASANDVFKWVDTLKLQ